MTELRKLAAILVTDIVGYSRLAGADEDRILARLRTLRSDLIEPTISVHRGRVVKGTGDGFIVEFRSVVDAVRCAIELQHGLMERNAGLPPERRIEFRVGIHLGDVVEESDGDLMGDGVNIAARLEGIAKPGAICLSEDAYRQVKGRLDLMVSDLGQTELKNIAEPIRVYSLEVGGGAQVSPAPSPAPAEKPAPLRLSIVVLPFISLGVDVEHELFVDGVTESLTTDLSRINNATVVSRNTAFTYKGKPVDAKQIGRDLNVRYVLEGSIQRGGSRMRINVQLIDAITGNHLWADRFDKPMADLFDMQDEIVSNSPINCARSCSPRKQGAPRLWRTRIPSISISREFNSSTRAGSTTSSALAAISSAPWRSIRPTSTPSSARRAPTCWSADLHHRASGRAPGRRRGALDQGHFDRAAQLLGTSLAGFRPDPNQSRFARDRRTGAGVVAQQEPRRGACVDRASRKSRWAAPTRPRLTSTRRFGYRRATRSPLCWTHIRGLAKLHLGADEEAVALFRRSVDASRNYPLSHFYMAAALAHLDRLDEARAEVKAGQALAPNYSIARFLTMAESDNPTYLKQRERIQDGLRKAGVAEK